MEKDNRSKAKRNRIRQFKKGKFHTSSQTSSPSTQVEGIRGIIDIADSSDDRFSFQSVEFDNSDDEFENEQMRAGDFSLLQNLSSGGTHFTLSSEKNWDLDDLPLEKSEASSYFILNLSLLCAGLQTIPFYKRMDYPPGIFGKADIERMNQEAEVAEKTYAEVLKEHDRDVVKQKPTSAGPRTASGKSSKSDKNSVVTVKENIHESKDDELDELLNLTTSSVAKVSFVEKSEENQAVLGSQTNETKSGVKAAEGDNAEEIQQWLDQVLE